MVSSSLKSVDTETPPNAVAMLRAVRFKTLCKVIVNRHRRDACSRVYAANAKHSQLKIILTTATEPTLTTVVWRCIQATVHLTRIIERPIDMCGVATYEITGCNHDDDRRRRCAK